MTDNLLAAFDPAAFKKRIAETVQSQFGMLIPADQFEAMVAKEIKEYFEEETSFIVKEEQRETGNSWNNQRTVTVIRATMTPFRLQIREEIAKLTAVLMSKTFDGEKFKAEIGSVYRNGTTGSESTLSDMLMAKVDEIAPKMAARMFQDVFAAAVQSAKSEVMSEISNRLPR